jgi:hypothetical protein
LWPYEREALRKLNNATKPSFEELSRKKSAEKEAKV